MCLVVVRFTSSNQRLFSREFRPTTHSLMMQMNMWSLVFLVPILVVTGHGVEGFEYFIQHPTWQYKAWTFAFCR